MINKYLPELNARLTHMKAHPPILSPVMICVTTIPKLKLGAYSLQWSHKNYWALLAVERWCLRVEYNWHLDIKRKNFGC